MEDIRDKRVKLPGQNNKKDTVLRMFYKDAENFAEIFNKTVFLKEKIRVEDLQESDSIEAGVIENKGEAIALHQERDIIKKYCNNKELMLLAIENSTYIDYAIPIKVLMYCCVNYNRQVMKIRDDRKKGYKNKVNSDYRETESEYLSRFRKEDKIEGIITLLIYYGEAEWDGPLSLCDMMNLSDEDKKMVADYKILHFIDVMRLTPEQLDKFEGQVKILLGFLRYKNDDVELERFIRDNYEMMNNATSLTENTIANMYNIDIAEICKEMLDIQSEGQIRNEMQTKNGEVGESFMNETLKKIFLRAKAEARKDGYDDGKKEIIANMQSLGLSIDNISLYTGLPISEVQSYIK